MTLHAVAPAGTVLLDLVCRACGTAHVRVAVDGVLDNEGDLAFDLTQIGWFTEAHYIPQWWPAGHPDGVVQ